MISFSSYGDLGDVIYLMPCMKKVGEDDPVTFYLRDGLREDDPFTAKLLTLAPLLLAQDYVAEVGPWEGEDVDYDACFFRDDGLPWGTTLAQRQAFWLKLNPDLSSPWLKVRPRRESPIIIHRSPRYHNNFFPWRELVHIYSREMAMIGTQEEWQDFVEQFGYVPRVPTMDLLEAAQVIAGAELFIGNQSCCYALAEGLKQATIQETCLHITDCIFPRSNAIYCHDGALDITYHGRRLKTKSKMIIKPTKAEAPPGGWRVKVGPCSAQSYAYDVVLRDIASQLLAKGLKVPRNLHDLIVDQSSTKAYLDHPVTRLKAELGA